MTQCLRALSSSCTTASVVPVPCCTVRKTHLKQKHVGRKLDQLLLLCILWLKVTAEPGNQPFSTPSSVNIFARSKPIKSEQGEGEWRSWFQDADGSWVRRAFLSDHHTAIIALLHTDPKRQISTPNRRNEDKGRGELSIMIYRPGKWTNYTLNSNPTQSAVRAWPSSQPPTKVERSRS